MIRLLSFVSGVPALIYQVVWTREVALLVGGQMEAISLVVVAFFGGLALGARWLGAWVDRTDAPLRFYGGLEVVAGTLAWLSIHALRRMGETLPGSGGEGAAPAASVFLIFPITFLLGGTTPALLRASVFELRETSKQAGNLTGANTAGSVAGVLIAIALIPEIGLLATMQLAAGIALLIGVFAVVWGRSITLPRLEASGAHEVRPRMGGAVVPLAVATIAGVATIGFEVVAARMAGIQLGSSLYAWGAVLATTLLGLAGGNFVAAPRAASSAAPALALARIEVGACVAILLGLFALAPNPTLPSLGLTPGSFLIVLLGVLPPAFAMGAAFPFFVRMAAEKPQLGQAFGTVHAFNTAGGIGGALFSSFYLLPAIGPIDSAGFFAGVNALLAVGLVIWAGAFEEHRKASLVTGGLVLFLFIIALSPPRLPDHPRVIHLSHGRQATSAVLLYGDRRDLVVDGDPEASTASAARMTEEFLAILPVMLHPNPQHLLEVGLGSGTTFGTASRFPLTRLECVEIAQSVLDSAPYFEPDNRGVATGSDERITILRGDGRAHLLKRRGEFDIVVANTLHPWSLGATGLYSREYFARLEGALRPRGIAAQWLPLGVIGGEYLAAILRSFYGAFEHGALFWGAGNVMLIGSDRPIPVLTEERFERLAPHVSLALGRLAIDSAAAFEARRVANLKEIAAVLGEGEVLSDDRPVLEARTHQTDHEHARSTENALIFAIARAGYEADRGREPLRLFLEARDLRGRGRDEAANRLEGLAELANFAPARLARLDREYGEVEGIAGSEGEEVALSRLRALVSEAPEFGEAWFSIAKLEEGRNRIDLSIEALERVVAIDPARGEAWKMLAVASWKRGDVKKARRAFDRAIEVAPYLPEALISASGFALSRGDRPTAMRLLARLEIIESFGPTPEADALRRRLAETN